MPLQKTEGLGPAQKWILDFFKYDENRGRDGFSIKELADHHHCIYGKREPTKAEMNQTQKIVTTLETRGLVKKWRIKNKLRRENYQFKPVWYTFVTLPDKILDPNCYEIFELNRRK